VSINAVIDYALPGPLTSLDGVPPGAFAGLATEDAVEICRPVNTLVVHRDQTPGLGLPPARLGETQLRWVDRILETLLALDGAPLSVPREPVLRVVGTCRDFAVLSCALLRRRGIAARVRCGFGTYFQPGLGLDHWITEYWHAGHDGHDRQDRWVRIDSEALGGTVVARPEDLAEGEFLTGGEAWLAHREGRIDAAAFGVPGTENFGPGEIRGNLIRDLAALNKVEVLPWDEWGRMDESYQGKTGADFDELMDDVAVACAGDDRQAVADLYANDELRAPDRLFSRKPV
jgi:Transglutaminase-like superfamily